MNFIEYFKENFYQKLKTPSNPDHPVRDRSDSMLKIFELLEFSRSNAEFPECHCTYIVETGSMRCEHGEMNFGGDGASTFIFDSYINYLVNNNVVFGYSEFDSVDINQDSCDYAVKNVHSKSTKIHCSDSVLFLSNLNKIKTIDLLYLDSFDVERGNHHPSSLHHLMELTASMKHLRPGSLVCVDDYDAFFDDGKSGKGVYIKQYFDKLGIEPIFEGYQLLYQMP